MAWRNYLRAAATALAVAVSLGVATPAHADDQSDLDKGRAAYEAKNYDDADRRFRGMLDPATGTLKDGSLIKQARMYWGAVMLGLNKPVEANAIFEKLLLDDPAYDPDPLSFPSSVLDAFIETRSKMRDRLNAAAADKAKRDAERKARDEADKKRQVERLRALEQMASEEVVTVHHSRWVAVLPFGAGQFQNRQYALGWAFLGVEAALIAGGLATYPIYYHQRSLAFDSYVRREPDARTHQLLDNATATQYVNGALYGGAALVAVIGVIQAEVAYVPEVVEVRKRPVPTAVVPTLTPLIAEAKTSGALVGVVGRF